MLFKKLVPFKMITDGANKIFNKDLKPKLIIIGLSLNER